MSFFKIVAITAMLLSISACGTLSAKFTATGDKRFEPLEVSCPVNIYTTKPEKSFYELGIVDIDFECTPFGCEREKINTAGATRDFIADKVCEAGGNAIFLWEANGNGLYKKAIVIRTFE